MNKYKKVDNSFYLVCFIVLGVIFYLHSLGIINPFGQLPTQTWVWVTAGISLGVLLEKGLQ